MAFNLLIIAHKGRLQYEALLLLACLRRFAPDQTVFIAEPQPGDLWRNDPRITPTVREALVSLGAEIRPFDSRYFGHDYPYGNKIEGLQVLPQNEPFLFLDSDTLITGDISNLPVGTTPPSASMKREGTWPQPDLYWPGYNAIWGSLYERFGLDFQSSLDLDQPDEYWERYLYFNAGWFTGHDPAIFHERFTRYARSIRDDPPEPLVIQPLDPWLDQVALPLVLHSVDGTRPGPALNGLDGALTCHYRTLPLLYAREPDETVALLEDVTAPNKLKKVLKEYDPFKRMIYQGRGHKVRALFDQNNLPRKEQQIRNTIKKNGFWMR